MKTGATKCETDATQIVTCRVCRLTVHCNRVTLVMGLGSGNRSAVVCVGCLAKIGRAWERVAYANQS